MWHFRGSRHTLTSPTHFLGSRSPNPLWSRYTPLDSRVADCVQLFCSPTTDAQHPSFRQSASSTLCLSLYIYISLSLVGAVALRLQQHQPHRTLDAYRFVCSLYLMRQQDWCATAANTTIFHVYCVLGTGCWSQTARRTAFRLAVLVFVCRNITASEYLARDWQWAVDDDSRKRLRSASSHKLVVRRSRLKTVGDRVFGEAATRDWNGLPLDVTSSQSLIFN